MGVNGHDGRTVVRVGQQAWGGGGDGVLDSSTVLSIPIPTPLLPSPPPHSLPCPSNLLPPTHTQPSLLFQPPYCPPPTHT